MTTGTKIGASCASAAVLVAGVVFERIPAPENGWLLILTGLTIALRPVAAICLVAAVLASIRTKKDP